MSDQAEKFTDVINKVDAIQRQLDQLLARLKEVKTELEAARTPFAGTTGPDMYAEETPHVGKII
jgi:hypothetical protein